MNPFLLIVVGGVVGLVVDTFLDKEKADGNLRQNGGDSVAGNRHRESGSSNQQGNGDGLATAEPEPEPTPEPTPPPPPTESNTDEVSSNGSPISDVRKSGNADDLSGE